MKNVAAARNNDGATKNKCAREGARPPAEARPLGRRSCGGAPAASLTRAKSARTWTQAATRGKHRELKRKLRAPTRRKARAREEPSPGPPASETDAGPLGHQPRGARPHPRFRRPRKRASLARRKIYDFGPELGFDQQNRFRNLRETQRTEKKAARTDLAQSARQGGTEPGATRFRDGRRTTGPPAPRGPAAPALQPRPRGRARPRKRASLARRKICDCGPELGFEQRSRFRSLRDTRRTEKNVLRKPPAGAPVVGQTFKYIY